MFVWILLPTYVASIGYVGTDIVKGTCAPWGVFASHAEEVAVMSSVFVITYMIPLISMIYCYIRIVYELRYKVSYTAIW